MGVHLLLEKAVTFLDRVEILRKGLEGLAVERMRRTRPELPEGFHQHRRPCPTMGKRVLRSLQVSVKAGAAEFPQAAQQAGARFVVRILKRLDHPHGFVGNQDANG